MAAEGANGSGRGDGSGRGAADGSARGAAIWGAHAARPLPRDAQTRAPTHLRGGLERSRGRTVPDFVTFAGAQDLRRKGRGRRRAGTTDDARAGAAQPGGAGWPGWAGLG